MTPGWVPIAARVGGKFPGQPVGPAGTSPSIWESAGREPEGLAPIDRVSVPGPQAPYGGGGNSGLTLSGLGCGGGLRLSSRVKSSAR